MNLKDTHINILRSINNISESRSGGAVASNEVANDIGKELPVVENHFNFLSTNGFIKTYGGKRNYLSENSTILADLTAKGKVAITNPDELNS